MILFCSLMPLFSRISKRSFRHTRITNDILASWFMFPGVITGVCLQSHAGRMCTKRFVIEMRLLNGHYGVGECRQRIVGPTLRLADRRIFLSPEQKPSDSDTSKVSEASKNPSVCHFLDEILLRKVRRWTTIFATCILMYCTIVFVNNLGGKSLIVDYSNCWRVQILLGSLRVSKHLLGYMIVYTDRLRKSIQRDFSTI